MTDEQIKKMANRFLQWKLPADFNPDNGISFDKLASAGASHESIREPVGTNLFTAVQAEAMVRFMVAGCKNHPDRPVRYNLDGDDLCQECCNEWVGGEEISYDRGGPI